MASDLPSHHPTHNDGSITCLSDEELVAQWYAGDDELFQPIYDRFYPLLMKHITRWLDNQLPPEQKYNISQIAEDITQCTFIRVLHTKDRLRSRYNPQRGARFRTWLFKIARNETNRYLLSAKNSREISFTDIDNEENGLDLEKSSLIGYEPYGMDVEDGRDLFSSLNYEEKKIIQWRFEEKRSLKEISRRLGVSIATAHRRIRDILMKIGAPRKSRRRRRINRLSY